MADFTVQMVNVEDAILREIADPDLKRNDIALTMAFGFRSGEEINWARVNRAIIDRWSASALDYIKERAWNLHQGVIQP